MQTILKGKKAQLKIQQMAFVLMAIMIFFALVALFYFSLSLTNLKESVESLKEQETKETVRKMSSSPEFSWEIDSCASCVDMDKIMVLKDRKSYEDFWNFNLMEIVKVYPKNEKECTRENYPDCGKITLIDKKTDTIAHSSFVALCRFEASENYNKCELGKIILGFKPTE